MVQYVVYLGIFPLALAGSILAICLPRIKHSYQRFRWLRAFNWTQLVFLLVNATELLTPDVGLKKVLASVDYLLLGGGTAIWLLFSLEYTGLVRHWRPWQLLLFAIPAITMVLGLGNGSDGLVWRDLRFFRIGWVTAMSSGGYGPGALATIFQSYALLLVGAVLLLQHTLQSHVLYRRQTAWMLAGILLPVVFNFLFVIRLVPGWNKDYSALAEALGGFCFSFACLRWKLFSVVPLSREAQYRQMHLGMMVTDAEDRIIDLNEAACRMLGKSEIGLLGSPVEPVLAGLGEGYELSRHPHRGDQGLVEVWYLEIRPKGLPSKEGGAGPEAGGGAEDSILSLGELRVVEMLALNLSNKEISDRLGVSVNTVKFHLGNVFRKTGAKNRAELLHRIGEILNSPVNGA